MNLCGNREEDKEVALFRHFTFRFHFACIFVEVGGFAMFEEGRAWTLSRQPGVLHSLAVVVVLRVATTAVCTLEIW